MGEGKQIRTPHAERRALAPSYTRLTPLAHYPSPPPPTPSSFPPFVLIIGSQHTYIQRITLRRITFTALVVKNVCTKLEARWPTRATSISSSKCVLVSWSFWFMLGRREELMCILYADLCICRLCLLETPESVNRTLSCSRVYMRCIC